MDENLTIFDYCQKFLKCIKEFQKCLGNFTENFKSADKNFNSVPRIFKMYQKGYFVGGLSSNVETKKSQSAVYS